MKKRRQKNLEKNAYYFGKDTMKYFASLLMCFTIIILNVNHYKLQRNYAFCTFLIKKDQCRLGKVLDPSRVQTTSRRMSPTEIGNFMARK